MEKIMLKKKEAAAIRTMLNNKAQDKQACIEYYLKYRDAWKGGYLPLAELGFDKFVQALYNGFEIEETPYDRVRNLFETENAKSVNHQISSASAIRSVLAILNIKIEGVNA
jgi:hypothetical protein